MSYRRNDEDQAIRNQAGKRNGITQSLTREKTNDEHAEGTFEEPSVNRFRMML